MKTFQFSSEIWLPRPREEIFRFFADACNLEAITPPWLRFQVLTECPVPMKPGALIDYRLRVRGIPLRWRTEIVEWNPPHHFVDLQLRGPYRLWRHTHTFEACDGGTLCRDEVIYRPPGGTLINWLFVRRDVEKIFAFRAQKLREFFPAPTPDDRSRNLLHAKEHAIRDETTAPTAVRARRRDGL